MEQTEKFKGEYYIVHSDAKCIDQTVGQDLPGYFEGILSPDRRAKVEQHLAECVACNIDAANWANIRAALKERLD